MIRCGNLALMPRSKDALAWIAATTLFEMDARSPGEGRPKAIYVRNKSKKPVARE